MPGFPISFDKVAPDGSTRAARCPYAIKEMRDYLDWCHHNYALDEPEGRYDRPQPMRISRSRERKIWLYQVNDPSGRPWWLIVGTGTSPFYGNAGQSFWRWMWAESQQSTDDPATYVNEIWQQLKRSDRPVDPDRPPTELTSNSGVKLNK